MQQLRDHKHPNNTHAPLTTTEVEEEKEEEIAFKDDEKWCWDTEKYPVKSKKYSKVDNSEWKQKHTEMKSFEII